MSNHIRELPEAIEHTVFHHGEKDRDMLMKELLSRGYTKSDSGEAKPIEYNIGFPYILVNKTKKRFYHNNHGFGCTFFATFRHNDNTNLLYAIDDPDYEGKVLNYIINGDYQVANTPHTKSMETIRNTIKKITRQEPEKTFVRVGFLDQNENITQEGLDALHYILWESHKDELKHLADRVEREAEDK